MPKYTCYGVLTVNALPTITVNSESICAGSAAATFTATATSGTPTSWLWSGQGTGVAQTTIGTTAGNYSVVGTDGNGCQSTLATGVLTVNALPTVTVNSESICVGAAAATFIATSGTATSWLWSGQGTGVAQTTSGTTAGNYSVVVTDGNGCQSILTTGVLTVNALPTITVNSESICAGSAAATFTATATSGTPTSWLWTGQGTGVAQTSSGTTAGNYSVVGTDGNGCQSALATGVLTVNALPTITVNSESICAGSAAATFTATATSGTPTSWLWSGQGTGVAQTTSGTRAGNYSVVGTDGNGCQSALATGVLTVNALPTVTVNSDVYMCWSCCGYFYSYERYSD